MPSDQSLFKFIVSSVAVELADQNGQRIIAEWVAKNQLVVLLISNENDALEHQLLLLAEGIRHWVESHLEFTVTIGIGSSSDNESGIGTSFDDALAAVNLKVSVGVNQIIDSVEIKGKSESEWFLYLEIIRSVVRQVRMSESEWKMELARLFGEMKVQRLRKEDVNRLLDYLVFHLEYELEHSIPEAVKLWTRDSKPSLLDAIGQCDTLGQLEQCFINVITGLFDHIQAISQSRRHNTLMREIRDYVMAEFMNPNLSLTLLSDKFQINSKYLSQLFKESIGQNFSDFLIGLRVNYAKKLLRESGVTVQEISDRMGYANPTSFIRVFKKIVGMSPGQYRDSHSQLDAE